MDDTRQIELEFVFTRELFRAAYRNLFDAKVKPQNFIWFGVILIIYFIYTFYTSGFHAADLWYYLPLLGIPLGLMFAKVYLPRKWGDKTYRQYEGKKFKWIITSRNIQIISDKSKATAPWSHFEKAVVGKEIIFLETADHKRTPIPVSAFKNDDLELFKTWLYDNVRG